MERIRRKLSGERNQCPTCSEFFNSNTAFEAHRVGPMRARRCLSPEEMIAKGMGKNAADYWVSLRWPEGKPDYVE